MKSKCPGKFTSKFDVLNNYMFYKISCVGLKEFCLHIVYYNFKYVVKILRKNRQTFLEN